MDEGRNAGGKENKSIRPLEINHKSRSCRQIWPRKLIKEGKIQILGHTAQQCCGREALGPGKDAEESDKRLPKEASVYKILGKHERILQFHGLETGVLDSPDSVLRA
ncbi:hypothetical protein CIRG_06093 [Coccidioides immitis RMSCC 2394]|uniref:Uncharacterized protein n=1 Tax=Coccidioides immitis RMSCC 2394 TaxID=404692 RepID=A0A0J7B8U5_COCIT|nr:hypothetical protein CIRG_06093 [Coccidioides immitis RMSCC 2394]